MCKITIVLNNIFQNKTFGSFYMLLDKFQVDKTIGKMRLTSDNI